MALSNELDSYPMGGDVVDRVSKPGYKDACLETDVSDRLIEHQQYLTIHGKDIPGIRDLE